MTIRAWLAVAALAGAAATGCVSERDVMQSPAESSTRSTATAAGVPATRSGSPVTATVTLEVGHCWVEPVSFGGERWGIPLREQFGWGGSMPRGWVGTGEMARLSTNRARYVDAGGAVISFLPEDNPAVAAVEGQICD